MCGSYNFSVGVKSVRKYCTSEELLVNVHQMIMKVK